MRFTILDGFRGWFLFFMMIAHINGLLQAPLGHVNHHAFGWVEDAQGFVFLSGLVMAMVYGRKLLKYGEGVMTRGLRGRAGLIWRYQAGLVLFFLALALALPMLGIPATILRQQTAEPVVFSAASLMLVTGTIHMGILPMYVWFVLATPFVLRQFQAGRAPAVFAGSAFLWLLAQTSLPDQAQLPIEAALAAMGHPINIGIYFNVFGWQVLFLAGLWLGWLLANDRLDLSVLRSPVMAQVFWIALAGFLLLGVLDVISRTGALGQDYARWVFPTIDRGNLHIVYLMAFAIDLYLVTWLVVAGRDSGWRGLAWAGAAITWLFTRPPLVMLGRHSLQVFVAHVLAVYALEIVMEGQDVLALPVWARNLILLAMTLPLFAVAWVRDRRRAAAPARRAAAA